MAGEIEEDNIVMPPRYRDDGQPQIITADTARQGPLGSRGLIVLLSSLAIVAVLAVIAFMVY